MITIRALIAGLMATLLAVISVATFLLVYFASLDSVESLTTLSVQTAADRISGQISTTLLDRVTNPLVAVARSARVRSFTAPGDDPYVQSGASDIEKYAWHGEWRTVFDDIVAGCAGCTIMVRFIDGAVAISFPQPGKDFRYHQFMRTHLGNDLTVSDENAFDIVTYKLNLQTFDEKNDTVTAPYKPQPISRVGSALWNDVMKKINENNLELPTTIPGLWANVDVTPNVELGGTFVGSAPSQVSMRANILITNQSKAAAAGAQYVVGVVSVYVPLDEIRSRSEASLPTENSRVFALSSVGVVTEVMHAAELKKAATPESCASSSTAPLADCLPSIASRNFEALTFATQQPNYKDACLKSTTASTPAPSDDSSSNKRASSKFVADGTVYFASPRCIETPFVGSDLRVVTLLPQSDVDSDLATGRDISIAIVVVFFFVSLFFGYFFVWFLLRPFEVIATRMKKAALLADNAPKEEGSCLEEVARLQRAYETMNDELLRLKGFVPQSVLALDADDDDKSNRSGIYTDSGNFGEPGMGDSDERLGGASPVRTGDEPGSGNSRSMTDLAAASSVTSGAGASIFRRAHIMAERLSVSVSAITRSHVAICVLNLRNFHGAIADMTTEDLSLATRQLVRIVTDVTADNRGVVDFFHGDHYVLTYNAARLCHSPTKSAIATSLRVADALVVDPVLGQLQRLGAPYHSGADSSSSDNLASGSGKNKSASSASGSDAGAGGSSDEATPAQPPAAPAPAPYVGPKIILSSGISAGEATVGSFGSSELKRFCTIGPCYSQAFEVELVLKDSPLLRRSTNTLPHSVGIPHFMFNHVYRMYGLEAVAMGMVTRQKTGIARVVGSTAEIARQRGAGATDEFGQNGMHSMLGQQQSTPVERMSPLDPASSNTNSQVVRGPYVSTRDCLEAFVDLCLAGTAMPSANNMKQEGMAQQQQGQMGGGKTLQQLQAEQAENRAIEERVLAALRKRDAVGTQLLESIVSSFHSDLLASVSAPMVEQQEEDVLNEAFASEEEGNSNPNPQPKPKPEAASATAGASGNATPGSPPAAQQTAAASSPSSPPPQEEASSPVADAPAAAAAATEEQASSPQEDDESPK